MGNDPNYVTPVHISAYGINQLLQAHRILPVPESLIEPLRLHDSLYSANISVEPLPTHQRILDAIQAAPANAIGAAEARNLRKLILEKYAELAANQDWSGYLVKGEIAVSTSFSAWLDSAQIDIKLEVLLNETEESRLQRKKHLNAVLKSWELKIDPPKPIPSAELARLEPYWSLVSRSLTGYA